MNDPSAIDRARRRLVRAGAAAGTLLWLRPVCATPDEQEAAIREFTGGAPVSVGKVKLDIALLVENGNTVPITVSVDSPMTAADHVRAIGVFNQRNPQPHVGVFRLSPRAGRAEVQARIRLATSQKVVAVAQLSDGSYWSHGVEVVVALAACVEGVS